MCVCMCKDRELNEEDDDEHEDNNNEEWLRNTGVGDVSHVSSDSGQSIDQHGYTAEIDDQVLVSLESSLLFLYKNSMID